MVLGDNCTIAADAQVSDAVIWNGTTVGRGATLHRCAIGENVTIGANTVIGGQAVVGDGCTIGAGNKLDNAIRINCNTKLPAEAITF